MSGSPIQPSGTITLLFSDIEGSTRLLLLGAERYALALDDHRRLLREAFGAEGGYEVDHEGDAFQVAFSSAAGAVAAAAAGQRALARHAWPDTLPLRVRMGIHTGEPRLAPPEYVGLDGHVAGSAMAVGHGGQVLVTQATRALLGARFHFRDLGAHGLPDLPAPVRLYQLEGDGLESEFPPLRTLANRPSNLPALPGALIGRERELVRLGDMLGDTRIRLVTVTGAGGAGKSRLALHAAVEQLRNFVDGVHLVRLAPMREGAQVPRAIAQTFGVRDRTGEALLETLAVYLRGRELLLVLDNFEHVADAAPSLALLLDRAPKLKLLVTSRVRLRLAAERVLRLGPLETPPLGADVRTLRAYGAAALFVERVEAADPEFVLDAVAAPAVAEVCVRVDGLPLALELAAARLALLSPRELVARLGHRLDALGQGGPESDVRQRTLRATLAWSHELLTPQARVAFATLAVVADGCALEAADALADGGADTLAALEELLEGNLINRRRLDTGSRFWMFETIREYALEQLASSGREPLVRDRLLDYACALATQETGRGDAAGILAVADFRRERALFETAMEWALECGDLERALALWFRVWHGWRVAAPSEAAAAGAVLAERTHALRSVQRVRLLDSLINIEGRRTGRLGVADQAQEALALARELGGRGLIAKALADAAWANPNPERSLRLMDEAVELARDGGALPFEFFLEARLAYARALDDRERLVADAARLLAQGRSIRALNENAWVSLRLGAYDEALAFAGESRGVLERDPDATSGWRGIVAETLGAVLLCMDDRAEAAKELRTALEWYHEVDFELESRWDLYALAAAYVADEAERALVLRGAAGDLEPVISGLCWLGSETQALGRRQDPLDAIPADTRARLQAIGRSMSREEAVSYALAGPLPGAGGARENADVKHVSAVLASG